MTCNDYRASDMTR